MPASATLALAMPTAAAPASGVDAAPATDNANRSKDNIPPLPLHAQLRFAVYLGGSSVAIGDLFHELNINGQRYTLLSQLEKAGLASWFNSAQLTQSSRGALSAIGDLVPEEFREEAADATGARHAYTAIFDWNAGQVRFADGPAASAPPGTLDMLSLLYQLSQQSFRAEKVSFVVTDGAEIKNILLEIGETEEIATPMGKLRALHLIQLHDQGTPGMAIWLGTDYRMLPVKFQKTGPDGRISEEWVVREIRVSDEQPTQ